MSRADRREIVSKRKRTKPPVPVKTMKGVTVLSACIARVGGSTVIGERYTREAIERMGREMVGNALTLRGVGVGRIVDTVITEENGGSLYAKAEFYDRLRPEETQMLFHVEAQRRSL